MKALIAEYTMTREPACAEEGRAMLEVLSGSFERCGYEVLTPEGDDFSEEIRRLAPLCEVGLVIAPDPLLAGFSATLEHLTNNIGCGSMSVAVCANKLRAKTVLAKHGVPVPEVMTAGLRIVKPIRGYGSTGVRLTDEPAGEVEFGERFIEGEHISVSMVGSRVVGDACDNYSGDPPLLLAVNRQMISQGPDGQIRYTGGETPIDHPRQDEIVATATLALNRLGCQGYTGVDMVVADHCYVVDVNPRITTSLVGIAACMEEEIADVLVSASHGRGPGSVHLSSSVRFDTHGGVTRL
jgi:predicted ATP-grasp superfamily ATP-dependent carboligase